MEFFFFWRVLERVAGKEKKANELHDLFCNGIKMPDCDFLYVTGSYSGGKPKRRSFLHVNITI